MNVEEYFPEGISEIHHDETPREVRISHNESDVFPVAIHCHICYKTISSAINNFDFAKPCNCQLMFVHAECAAKNRKAFGEAKCSSCGHDSTIPRPANVYQIEKVGCSRIERACTHCNESFFQGKGNTFRTKIEPCFCRKVYHLGCLRQLIESKAVCSDCHVVFIGFKPATWKNFFTTYWRWYTLYLLLISICSTVLVVAVRNSLILTKVDKTKESFVREILLTLISLFFFIVIISAMLIVIKYTIITAVPEFKSTHGKVVLKPFKTRSNALQATPFQHLQEKEFEDIPLNELRKAPAEDTVREDARTGENDDMTLGQHMFGVYATHQSSSTPIEKPLIAFAFNSA